MSAYRQAFWKNPPPFSQRPRQLWINFPGLIAEAEAHEEGRDRAVFFRESVVPAMKALRKPVDELEMIVDKDMWPMPSYGDLIFEV